MKKAILAAALAGSVLTLAGCGQDVAPTAASPSTTASATPTETATPTPTPTEISKEDAAAQYLALVEPYNETVRVFNEVSAADWDQAAFTAAAAAQADANQAVVEGLLTKEWPAASMDMVQTLAADAAPNTSYMRRLAEAQTLEEAWALIETQPEQTDGSAQLLRIQLGLDEIPVTAATSPPPADESSV